MIAFLFLILSSSECIGKGVPTNIAGEGVYGNISDESGSPISGVAVSIFDGFTLYEDINTNSDGRYKISKLPVSADYYAVIFFTKLGYIPEAATLKVLKKEAVEYSIVMKNADNNNTGFVIGTIYQPIRGGKLQYKSGIYHFGKKIGVLLGKDGATIRKETDKEGHFLFEVPPGIYKLRIEGNRKSIEVVVSKGKTVIQNLRSGIALID